MIFLICYCGYLNTNLYSLVNWTLYYQGYFIFIVERDYNINYNHNCNYYLSLLLLLLGTLFEENYKIIKFISSRYLQPILHPHTNTLTTDYISSCLIYFFCFFLTTHTHTETTKWVSEWVRERKRKRKNYIESIITPFPFFFLLY